MTIKEKEKKLSLMNYKDEVIVWSSLITTTISLFGIVMQCITFYLTHVVAKKQS